MLAAGGTGGHVFPALALAKELVKRGAELVWVGRRSGLESECAARNGFAFESLPAAGYAGKRLGRKLVWPLIALAGIVASFRLLSRHKPDALVACGGYVSFAPLAACLLSGRPYFLLEQNRVPGRVTRMFSGRAIRCFYAFPPVGRGREEKEGTKEMEGGERNRQVCGNPLREEMLSAKREDDGRTVLVLGGSGGARALTLAGLDAAAALANLHFIILTGRRDYESAKALVRSSNVELVEFTDRPDELYRRATIAVSRAGGMVLSELTAFGIPAVLVPFPYAADRHQEANAQYLESVGAAIMLDQGRLSGLTTLVNSLMDDEGRRRRMQEAALAAARPDAGQVIADRIVTSLSPAREVSCSAS